MITIQQAIFSRLSGDTTDKQGSCLKTLLGGTLTGRIFAGMDLTLVRSPSIVFNNMTNVAGEINSDFVQTDVEFYTFKIFANNAPQIISRLRQLFDRYTFTETAEAGVLTCVWDNDGPDLFDDDLKVRRKDVRFRIYSMPKAIGPI